MKFWEALQIKPDERKGVKLLVSYSFFMGASIAFFYTAAISLFLHRFDRNMLPYVYMAGGLAIYVLGYFFRTLQKKSSISRILVWSLVFLILTTATIAIGYIFTANKWLAFIMFLWINVFLFVHGLIFNGLASSIFSLQQGKRLYSLLGVGEVVSNVLGFFSVPLLLKFIHTEHLPLLTLVFLCVTLVILLMLIRSFWRRLAIRRPAKKQEAKNERTLTGFFKQSFLVQMFVLAILPVFGLYFVDYIFFGQTQLAFPQKEVLSGFIGIFFGISALVEFVIKTFVYGRMTEKYGVKPGLVGLPLALIISTFLASLSGTFFGVASMFSFVVLSKLFMRSLKNSLSDPSYLILLQVLPTHERFSFQAKVEGGPKAFSNILVGAVIILITGLGFSLVHFNYFFILVLIFWVWASFRMFHTYQNELKKVLNAKGTVALPAGATSSIALSEMNGHGPGNEWPTLIQEIFDPYGKGFNTSEKLPVNNLSIQDLDRLSLSHSEDDRLIAAQQLGYAGRFQAIHLLNRLLTDAHPKVRKAAIFSSGLNKSRELWPLLFENLLKEEYHRLSSHALACIGAPVYKEVDLLMKKYERTPSFQHKLVNLIGIIGKPEGIKRLRGLISHPDRAVRKEVLQSLVRNKYRVNISEEVIIRQVIEEEVSLIVWTLAGIRDLCGFDNTATLVKALDDQAETGKQFLFSLLSLIFEPSAIQKIQESFGSPDREARIYAVELFDMMVSSQIKDILLPLFQSMSTDEILTAYQYQYPQEVLSLRDRLVDILYKDYSRVNSWIKACTISLLSTLTGNEIRQVMQSQVLHPDELISEAAVVVLAQDDPDLLQKDLSRFGLDQDTRIQQTISLATRKLQGLTDNRKIVQLSALPPFLEIPGIELVNLIQGSRCSLLHASEPFQLPLESKREVVFLATSSMVIEKDQHVKEVVSEGTILGDLTRDLYFRENWTYRGQNDGYLFEFQAERFYLFLSRNKIAVDKFVPSHDLTNQS